LSERQGGISVKTHPKKRGLCGPANTGNDADKMSALIEAEIRA
jgi:hypothetical protein